MPKGDPPGPRSKAPATPIAHRPSARPALTRRGRTRCKRPDPAALASTRVTVMSKAPGLETGTQLVIDSSCVPLSAPLGMVSPELPPRWTTTESERVGEFRPPEAARKMSMLPQNSMSPELYPRTRRTLPELIAHPSQFAREFAVTPLPSLAVTPLPSLCVPGSGTRNPLAYRANQFSDRITMGGSPWLPLTNHRPR